MILNTKRLSTSYKILPKVIHKSIKDYEFIKNDYDESKLMNQLIIENNKTIQYLNSEIIKFEKVIEDKSIEEINRKLNIEKLESVLSNKLLNQNIITFKEEIINNKINKEKLNFKENDRNSNVEELKSDFANNFFDKKRIKFEKEIINNKINIEKKLIINLLNIREEYQLKIKTFMNYIVDINDELKKIDNIINFEKIKIDKLIEICNYCNKTNNLNSIIFIECKHVFHIDCLKNIKQEIECLTCIKDFYKNNNKVIKNKNFIIKSNKFIKMI